MNDLYVRSLIIQSVHADFVRFVYLRLLSDCQGRENPLNYVPVSYTHLTLPTIYSV